jgi:photosystem II stability/assembly factor-like uncharacterized protein
MKTYITLLFSLFLLTAKSQWLPQISGTTNHLRAIQFLNKDTGYCAGQNYLIKTTTDGGLNWVQKNLLPISGSCYFGMDFLNDTGFVVGLNAGSGPMPTTNSRVDKTTNSANTLVTTYSMNLATLYGVDFVNSQRGWAVGGAGGNLIISTSDGGANWVTAATTATTGLFDVHFPVMDTGYVCGMFGTISKTVDGVNWITQNSGVPSHLYSIFFVNSKLGYCVGDTGRIIKTIDGGATWVTQVSGTTNILISVFFINSQKGYAVGTSGTILYTNNGGANWTQQNSGVTNTLYSVHFPDSLTGYICGDNGLILKTTNGGVLSVDENTDLSLIQLFPNPTSGKISLQFGKSFVYNLIVYNAIGEIVLNKFLCGDSEIDLSKFASGVYNLSIQSEKGTFNKKVIKH